MALQPAQANQKQSHAAQVGIALAAVPVLQAAFSKIPVTGSWDKRAWSLGVAAIIRRYASASSALAVRQYKQERRSAGIAQPFTPRPKEPTLAQIGSATDWTIGTLYGDGGTRESAEANLLTASERLILNANRETTIANVEQDRQARAWARETAPGCCWFCAMLATRGAVYSSSEAAGKASPDKGQMPTGLDEQGNEFVNRFHNHCRCRVVPVFGKFEPQAHVRDWQALWDDATGNATGMENKQNAWKTAFADWQQAQ